jgi:Domain of unknown function (DUF4397)
MLAPRRYRPFLALLLGATLSGCGGNSMNTMMPTPTPQQATSNLRVVSANASEGSINVLVDGQPATSNVTFLKNTGYVSVPAGSHQVTLQGWVNPPNESFMANLPENGKSTLLFEGWGPFSSGASVVPDDTTAAASGNFKLRIVDTTVGITLDTYVLPAGIPPSGTPTFSPMTISENSPSVYLSLPAGNYHVVFTAFQTLNVQFDTGALTFAAGQNRTLLLINNCALTSCSFSAYTSMVLSDLN